MQSEGQIRAAKESERARCTDPLERVDRGTSQVSKSKRAHMMNSLSGERRGWVSQERERKRARMGYSHPRGRRERDRSGRRMKASLRRTLTPYKAQREGQVRDNERKRVSKEHSQLPGERSGQDNS